MNGPTNPSAPEQSTDSDYVFVNLNAMPSNLTTAQPESRQSDGRRPLSPPSQRSDHSTMSNLESPRSQGNNAPVVSKPTQVSPPALAKSSPRSLAKASSLPPMAPTMSSESKSAARPRPVSPSIDLPSLLGPASSQSAGGREPPGGTDTLSTGIVKDAFSEEDPLIGSLRTPRLPEPKEPSRSPLFCCFFAEFDNIVGPKVSFQSPLHFMDQPTELQLSDIHSILGEAFERIERRQKMSHDEDSAVAEDSSRGFLDRKQDETESSMSIFDATSEYIITGNELAGKMINLSTHSMHILTRPTEIVDNKYDRNSLLFSVGFVLRRAEDPRPFRPLLAKWAAALYNLEVESEFLSNPMKRPRMQSMLDQLLVSLNSSSMECNILLNEANWVNLRLYRPPKPPATPVPDNAVPVLIREDLLNLYDWDLAIKWIVLHIDGVDNSKQIATKADVDMEMARACLRVLKHHGVVSFVDMFFYSNRYESTARAAAMLAGKEQKLLQEAVDYVSHRLKFDPVEGGKGSQETLSASAHHDSSLQATSFPPEARSHPGSFKGYRIGSIPSNHELYHTATARREQRRMKGALLELYCSCQPSVSLCDILLSKIQKSNTAPSLKRETENIDDDPFRRPRSHSVGQSEARNKSDVRGIDWKTAFKSFDHRRFATFGIIHGLLRRVHDYPFVVERTNAIRIAPGKRSMPSIGQGGLDRTHSELVTSIATKMDGTRSDDELVCMFEKPLREIFQIVGSTHDIISLFSAQAQHT